MKNLSASLTMVGIPKVTESQKPKSSKMIFKYPHVTSEQ